MTPKPLVTFDCYGTLVDWRDGVLRAFHEHVPAATEVGEEELFSTFREVQNEIEAGPYRPYRAVLEETARRAAERLGGRLDRDDRGFLARTLPDWPLFPDANPTLERLASAGHRLGILSNVDDDLLAATLGSITTPFDLLVTAEQLRRYKPAPDHFLRALEFVGRDPGRIVHVAGSCYHDIRPAASMGLSVVWVNREGRTRPAGPPLRCEVRSLREVIDCL